VAEIPSLAAWLETLRESERTTFWKGSEDLKTDRPAAMR
jgi:hypothetical protein